MKALSPTAILAVLVLLFSAHAPLWADTNPDEARLAAVQKDVDANAVNTADSDKVQQLSEQFQVAPSVVEGLRASNQGWGEITIQLAMAQQLTTTDALTYPTMSDALARIEALRSENMGWGKIANDLGFKLGPVVSAAAHARHELTTARPAVEARPERPERQARPERPEKPQRPPQAL